DDDGAQREEVERGVHADLQDAAHGMRGRLGSFRSAAAWVSSPIQARTVRRHGDLPGPPPRHLDVWTESACLNAEPPILGAGTARYSEPSSPRSRRPRPPARTPPPPRP